MVGIFPPLDKGGQPPGANVCNGYTPAHKTIGEGPLYYAADCTTNLPDCSMNSIMSEMLALVDGLGYPWNVDRLDNLANAVRSAINAIVPDLSNFVARTGDTMAGPFILSRDPQNDFEAATKRYVDQIVSTLNATLYAYIAAQRAELEDDYRARINAVDAAKINRAGDEMQGPLILSRQPVLAMEATTKSYVDTHPGLGGAGPGPGGGIPEAPYDDRLYGRINQTWMRIIDDGEYT